MTITLSSGGYLVAEATVKDNGGNQYREHVSYLYYTRREVRDRFKQHLKENNLTEVK